MGLPFPYFYPFFYALSFFRSLITVRYGSLGSQTSRPLTIEHPVATSRLPLTSTPCLFWPFFKVLFLSRFYLFEQRDRVYLYPAVFFTLFWFPPLPRLPPPNRYRFRLSVPYPIAEACDVQQILNDNPPQAAKFYRGALRHSPFFPLFRSGAFLEPATILLRPLSPFFNSLLPPFFHNISEKLPPSIPRLQVCSYTSFGCRYGRPSDDIWTCITLCSFSFVVCFCLRSLSTSLLPYPGRLYPDPPNPPSSPGHHLT